MLLLVLAPARLLAAEPGQSLKILLSPGPTEIKIKALEGGVWEAKGAGGQYRLEPGKGDKLIFTLPDQTRIEAVVQVDRAKFKRNGDLWLGVKLYPDKIKVDLTESGSGDWEYKDKGDKIKVYRGEGQTGKVKYYPETGKLKAKDNDEKEVAVIKGAGRPSAVLAPFLSTGLSPERQVCLALLLLHLGR